MQTWLNYFERNQKARVQRSWKNRIQVEPKIRTPLISSLQKFQLGESGEGRKLKQHAANTGDSIYASAIDLFIKEEQNHSRLLGQILHELNAPLLKSHWSDRCFVLMRHMFGLREELMVLLLPEMIAKHYFRALSRGIGDPILSGVFGQIAQDEEGHLAFHIDYLRRFFKDISFTRKMVILAVWRILFRATCGAVILDHRTVLNGINMPLSEFWRSCGQTFDEVAAGIFSPAHLLVPSKLIVCE